MSKTEPLTTAPTTLASKPRLHSGTLIALFLTAVFVFDISLLTVFRAPIAVLWMLKIAVTEMGHLFALYALIASAIVWRFRARDSRLKLCALIYLIAVPLYLTPILCGLRLFPDEVSLLTAFSWPKSGPEPIVIEVAPPPGSNDKLNIDFYKNNSCTPTCPLVITIHGGGWRSGSRKQMSEMNYYLVAQGFHVAAIEYRLAPAFRFPAQLDDVLASYQTLLVQAGSLNIDTNRISFLGRSAGGQLALLAAYRLAAQAKPSPPRAVVSLYGPTDLRWGYENAKPGQIIDSVKVIGEYLGGSPAEISETFNQASPVQFVQQSTPRTLMIHGQDDELVSIHHSEILYNQLQRFSVPSDLIVLPWATHAFDYFLNGPGGQIASARIVRFLNQ